MIQNWIRKYHKELKNENLSSDGLVKDIDRNVSEVQKLSKIVYTNFKSMIE